VAGDRDVYEFTGQAGDRVFISAKKTSGYLYPYIYLFPSDGSNFEASGAESVNCQLSQSGTYKIVIQDGDDDGPYSDQALQDAGSYNITLLNLTGCSGVPIGCDETLSGSLVAGDRDVYEFTGQAGDRVFISAKKTSGHLYPYIYLFPSDGSNFEASGAESVNCQLSQSGTYKIVIQDGDDDGPYSDQALQDAGSYKITLECEGAANADLVISSLSVVPNAVTKPQSATVGWTIGNAGSAAATPAGYWLKVRLSGDAVYDESDSLVGQVQVMDVLAAGGTLSGTFTFDSGMHAEGNYYLVAKVDTENIVNESFETNNTASVSITILSSKCTVTISSSEGGLVTDPGEGTYEYDGGTSIPIAASPEAAWRFTGWTGTAVDAGKVADPSALSTTVMVDGDYTLHANFVSDGEPELPDLAISADDIQLLTYDGSDSTITIDAAIHNVGTATASAVIVHFYEFDTLLFEAEVAEIPAGEMRRVPITIPMPAAGERLIQVVLDPLNTVEELDETNNEATRILLVNIGDVTEGYILITGRVPSSVCSGSSFSVTGTAVYDLYVDGVRYTDYAVKGGMVEMTVIGPDGEQWLYGGHHTNIYGAFSQVLQAPGTLGIYRLLITVTDNTFIGECELVFEVKDCSSSTPPPGPPYGGPGGGGGGGGSGYWVPPGSGGGGGSTEWTWVWTTPPPNVPASDVYVYSEHIHFSINHPDTEQEITIFAEIHYWAQSTDLVAYNVPINIYATYPGEDKIKIGETLIDELTVGWPDFGSEYVFTTWKTNREGIYIIEVEVDPSYSEQNMLNNAATRAIIVGDLGHPWGAIEGQVREALGGVDDVIMDLYDADHTILIESKVTDNGGYYLFTNLPAGTYQVHIRVPDGYVADAQTKPAEVVAQSITTVNFFLSQTAAPVADAGDPYSGEVGLPVTLDASGSYDPDGVIVSYEWDCNGDGEYDQITSSSQMPYTWDIAYNGTITLRVTDDDGLTATDTATVTITSPPPCEVGVDIYPNRIPNPVYLSRNYTLYVAILGSANFEVSTVDSSTVKFGRTGTEASPVRPPIMRDLNADGFIDAMYGFMTFDCKFQLGDTEGILTGSTTSGVLIEGRDSVVVSP
jgi:hypothetical protein